MFKLTLTLLQEISPVIMLDSKEPLPFTEVAVSVVENGKKSPSSNHILTGDGDYIIEYGLWGDLEIGHANELEHIWVHLDAKNQIVQVEGSAHGLKIPLTTPRKGERPVAYSEPGKHGMSKDRTSYQISKNLITTLCTAGAGNLGVLHKPIKGNLGLGVENHRKAWNYLRTKKFTPAYDNKKKLDTLELQPIPWKELSENRIKKSLRAIEDGGSQGLNIQVGAWGSASEAWVGKVIEKNGELYLNNEVLQHRFEESLQQNKLVVVIPEKNELVPKIQKNAWENYTSATSIILSENIDNKSRPCSIAVPEKTQPGSAHIVVTEKPEIAKTHITLGPGGDYSCDMELLKETGYLVK